MSFSSRLIVLTKPRQEIGLCWAAMLPADLSPGDTVNTPARSGLRLFEDDREIGPGHAMHDDIRQFGNGRFSHWGREVYFSSSDGSSPTSNGRRYTALVPEVGLAAHAQVCASAAALDPGTLTPEQRYAWGERLFSLFVSDAKLAEYARSFFDDQEFLADYERFDRQNYRSLDRKFAVREFLKLALRNQGHAAECGVFKGATAYIVAKTLKQVAPDKRLHLFDSFAGLSSPKPIDGNYWTAGALSCGLQEVEKNLEQFGDQVVYYPGWIPERFADVADEKFCFVHLDVDLYQPTRDALHFFYPRLVPGAVMICDDYGFNTCPGARRAMDEFFSSRPEPILHLPTGQGVVIRASH